MTIGELHHRVVAGTIDLDRAARLANMHDAFQVLAERPLPATVILVDDIITTTATLEACAAVLRDAGVPEVYGFAIAREV